MKEWKENMQIHLETAMSGLWDRVSEYVIAPHAARILMDLDSDANLAEENRRLCR